MAHDHEQGRQRRPHQKQLRRNLQLAFAAKDSTGELLAELENGEDFLSRMTDALISIQFFDGGKFEGLVSVNNPKMLIPGESNLYPTNYFWLGVEHLLSGIDHLIFVLGLIFLVVGYKTLIKTIPTFSVGVPRQIPHRFIKIY